MRAVFGIWGLRHEVLWSLAHATTIPDGVCLPCSSQAAPQTVDIIVTEESLKGGQRDGFAGSDSSV